VKIPWASLPLLIVTPHFALNRDSLTLIVAVFGTTISPYLFFWQSNEEVEELQASSDSKSLLAEPGRALVMMRRVGLDTVVGMAFSEAIAFFVILTAGATLNQHGVTNIATAAQAAQALRPIAGDFAYLVFSLGIIGTGLLAIPVLAGSAAYAAAETRGWREGLSRKLNEAPEFYAVIAASILGGMALSFSSLDPIQALFWAAVINGVVAVPIMVAALIIATNKRVMGQFTANRFERLFGWLGVAVMGVAAVVMLSMMAHS
jgi:Mn2+/Fe2+ NRAMP family transporter